ncbi:MAG: hypothetical protein IKX33_10880 [Prevotella sp.]|nr:hypothetical protein [Prevotella sp.]
MKKSLFLRVLFLAVTLLLSWSLSIAQESELEHYPVGTTWEEVYTDMGYVDIDYDTNSYNPVSFARYVNYVGEDTIIDAKNYKNVFYKIIENTNNPAEIGKTGRYFLREQEDKIFYRSYSPVFPGGDSIVCDELLIYDFNWQENDMIIRVNRNSYNVQELNHSQEILLDGNTYEYYSYTVLGVEKKIYRYLGQTACGLIRGELDELRMLQRFVLTKFTRNNVLIYEREIPTPQVDFIHERQMDNEAILNNCYSTQGIKMDARYLKPGIYIQNGRKYVVK